MIADAILLVSRAERDGGDDRPRLWVWLRADVNRASSEAVNGLLHAVRVSVGVPISMMSVVLVVIHDRWRLEDDGS